MNDATSYSSLNNDNDPSRIQRLSELETAMEIMASMLGKTGLAEVSAIERDDQTELSEIREETKKLLEIRDAIYRGDGNAIDRAIREFGPIIKASFLAA